MARRGRPPKAAHNVHPYPLASRPTPIQPEVIEEAVVVSVGPTTGYRDAEGGKVERRIFSDGRIPQGWFDTPAKCENCDGKSHPEYVEWNA